jgi:hypothetical protein
VRTQFPIFIPCNAECGVNHVAGSQDIPGYDTMRRVCVCYDRKGHDGPHIFWECEKKNATA